MALSDAYAIYEFDVTLTERDTRRDVHGWVEGHGPGCDRWREPKAETYRVVCRRESQARERAFNYFQVPDVKDLAITEVRKIELHGLVIEMA